MFYGGRKRKYLSKWEIQGLNSLTIGYNTEKYLDFFKGSMRR